MANHKALTEDEIVELLTRRLGKKTKKDFAEEIGVTPPYLGDVLAGKRAPGPAILRFLKIKRQVVYAKR
jgi:hypothetical protein